MKKISDETIEKIYAGWLGKVIGIRLGAPVEMWSSEQIQEKFAAAEGYLVDYRDFAADDDSNGPIFFFRTLLDYGIEALPEQFGMTWLNYAADGHGFFWWGGYGVSSEHTAYLNLKNGIKAPQSGSLQHNGKVISEQIGGQIFSDVWGLVSPYRPEVAARYAQHAASVSHDGEAVLGAKFVAACISCAFSAGSVDEMLDGGLQVIPPGSEYASVVGQIRRYHGKNPQDQAGCFAFIKQNFWKDRYAGNCHIIPNIAIMIMALTYGAGDFDKTLTICNRAGFDTDCNNANVGCMLGVLNGLKGINYEKWRAPINDVTLCSSVVGFLNIVDIPDFVFAIARTAVKIAGQCYHGKYERQINCAGMEYSFALPGSTHGFRCEGANVKNTQGSLEITQAADSAVVYRKTYYCREDLQDNRYDPCFSPLVYPGQTVSAKLSTEGATEVAIFAEDINTGKRFVGNFVSAQNGVELSYTIPPSNGVCIHKIGLILCNGSGEKTILHQVKVQGAPDYTVDLSRAVVEEYALEHTEIREFTHRSGNWRIENQAVYGSCADYGELYTGSYGLADYSVECRFQPINGRGCGLLFRVQGGIRGYAAVLSENGRIALKKNCNGYTVLKEVEYLWRRGDCYRLRADVRGAQIKIYVNDAPVIAYEDKNAYLYGCFGAILEKNACARFDSFAVRSLTRGEE